MAIDFTLSDAAAGRGSSRTTWTQPWWSPFIGATGDRIATASWPSWRHATGSSWHVAGVVGISADTVPMNAAMVDKLALPFPILSDPDRDKAITPLGFADEKDAREIACNGALVISPSGEVVVSLIGRDFADRPEEDELLDRLASLDLSPTTQALPAVGEVKPGERAMSLEALPHYRRGAKFASLAIRGRHRDLGDEFAADTKRYAEMVDRYLDALTVVKQRRE